MIDWKQGNQSGALAGLALSHVSGDLTGTSSSSTGGWWNHANPINEIVRGATIGTTGWLDFTTYEFDLTFTDSLIEIFVGGNLELSWSQAQNGGNAFTDGAFGFYNFSQSNVEYAGITQDVISPVPLPAGLPLLSAGLGVFGLVRRRKT